MTKYGVVFKYEDELYCMEYLDDLGNISDNLNSITDEHNYYTDSKWDKINIDLVKIETYQEDVMYMTSLCRVELSCDNPDKDIMDFIREVDFKEFAKELFEGEILNNDRCFKDGK